MSMTAAKAKLEELAKLPENWDGHGAIPLRLTVLEKAKKFLAEPDLVDLPTPAVVLGSGGAVHFEWQIDGRELEIEVLLDGSMEFLQVENGDSCEGTLKLFPIGQLCELVDWLMEG
jgi:hypothetical protein